MKLLKIVSDNVDVVLVAVKEGYDREEVIALASDMATDFRGEVWIEDEIDIPDYWLDSERCFVG